MDIRVGIGYDIHRLVEGRKLIVGGVEIPYLKGLLGHSDADCLLHAITDALLGAMAADDIGTLFPDTDPAYQGASSADLLIAVKQMLEEKGYVVNNLDTVLVAQVPSFAPFKKLMGERIAQILGVGAENVAVKAKTNEGLGGLGSGEAIAAYAVVTIRKRD